MVDQGDAKLSAVHARRRFGLLDVRNETRRWLGATGELPSETVQKPARLRGVRIEKACPVRMLRKRRYVVNERGTGFGVFQ